MQIKITVDIDNTDILKFFDLFKKDLATVAKNTTVETVAEEPQKTEEKEHKIEKKAQKKQSKNDCADFSGVQQQEEPQTEEKSDSDNNSLETDLSFSVFTIESKVNLVKSMLVDLANHGRKAEAKEILTKNKVPALSKLCDASEKTLIKIYNEVKNAQ